MKNVTLYVKSGCPHCAAAEETFDALNVPYTKISVYDEEHQDEYSKLADEHNHHTAPMIFIGDEFIGGNDNLQALREEGVLEEKLQ